MNKNLKMHRRVTYVLPILAVASFTSSVQAQSSVAMYGRVVAGMDYISNVKNPDGTTGSLLRGAGNQWGTSMLGFMGDEDLGGGLKALFRMEAGFDATKGALNGDAFFNRRSYVGLSSKGWGTLTLGKNLFLSNDVWSLDPTGQQFIGSATLVRGRNWQGANNIIEYQSPAWGGFQLGLQTGLGEQPGSLTKSRRDAASLMYSDQRFELRGIYDAIRDSNGQYSSLYDASKEYTLGGIAKFDGMKVYATFQRLKASDAPTNVSNSANHYWLGVAYDVMPTFTLIGTVFRTTLNKHGGSANLYMIGGNYNLSKRTLLYTTYGRVQNSRKTDFSVEADDRRPPAGEGQNGFYAGISHTF